MPAEPHAPRRTAMTLADKVREVWNAGVASVRADALTAGAISMDDQVLSIDEHSFERGAFDRVLVVGAGKAVAAMASAIDELLSSWLPTYGWVNVPAGTYDADSPSAGNIRIFPARPAGINEPTHAAIEGTREILRLVREASPRDLCLVLLSGGGSALLAAPAAGVSLEDKLTVTRFLSSTGATIEQLNTVRKQLSDVKGGRLARECRAGQLVTLVLSDVLGDRLDIIASGPTVANTSTAADALDVLKQYDSNRVLPRSVYDVMESRIAAPMFPIEKCPIVVLGNNATAVDAAGIHAESLGFSHAMTSATRSEGSAESVGIHHAEMALSMLRDRDAGKLTPDCLITGGEPTVDLAPAHLRGRGGRNMHLVLAAMKRLQELNVPQQELDRIIILSGGTDGEDGPTDAAGAMLSGDVWRSASQLGLEVADFLARSDSYTFFERAGGLLITGPTHTNVCDLRVVAVSPPVPR
ncbi:MAG: glycerate kinase type-2 family protein [Planctomycetaceae bacterium]